MPTHDNILAAIGRTPLFRLHCVTRDSNSVFYAKAEFLNPGGSVKDRVGLSMIEAAEREGLLRPGGTIVEATAGNTGAGLALVAAVKGYRTIFVLPDKMSEEKIRLLKAYGAEIVITPTAVPPDSPESYNAVAKRLAAEIPGAWRAGQFENPNNPLIHETTTGPEIWEGSDGKVDVFVAGMGTGGTISGTAKFLKGKNPNIVIVGADPEGSILSGDSPHPYKVEGIGEDFIPKTFYRELVDEMVRVSDKESFLMARRLAREEGLLAGGSSGTAVAAALKYSQRLREPKYFVVLLPDTGRNYLSKIYSDEWMQAQGYLERSSATTGTAGDVLALKQGRPKILSVSSRDKLDRAIALMNQYGISQLPVIDDGHVVGSVNEASVMKLLYEGVEPKNQVLHMVMGKSMPALPDSVDLAEAHRVLLSGAGGIVVTKDEEPVGVITRADLIHFWTKTKESR
jgi:cystathionine beta-synthase